MKTYNISKKKLIEDTLVCFQLNDAARNILITQLDNNPVINILYDAFQRVRDTDTMYYVLEKILVAYIVERVGERLDGKSK